MPGRPRPVRSFTNAPACRDRGNRSGNSDRRTAAPSLPAPPVHHLPEADAPVPEGILPDHLKPGSAGFARDRPPDRPVVPRPGDPPLAGGPDSEGSGEPFHRVARHRAVPTARKGDAGEA